MVPAQALERQVNMDLRVRGPRGVTRPSVLQNFARSVPRITKRLGPNRRFVVIVASQVKIRKTSSVRIEWPAVQWDQILDASQERQWQAHSVDFRARFLAHRIIETQFKHSTTATTFLNRRPVRHLVR